MIINRCFNALKYYYLINNSVEFVPNDLIEKKWTLDKVMAYKHAHWISFKTINLNVGHHIGGQWVIHGTNISKEISC